jgi:membrane-associated protein
MEILVQLIDMILHLDQHLNTWISYFGPWIYVVLFLIIFCETGLVVMPFLPGDSLLFALGALTTVENPVLSLPTLLVLLLIAAVLGDAVNYTIGKAVGPKVFKSESSRWWNREHLIRTQKFYEKHGGKTIILARFMPIVRTFAPFVAGIGKMSYPKFALFNVVGAIFWIFSFLFAGHWFGNLPAVKSNFHIVIFAIIMISFMPVLIEFFKTRLHAKRAHQK